MAELEDLAAERSKQQKASRARVAADKVDDVMARWDAMASPGGEGSALPEIDLGFTAEQEAAGAGGITTADGAAAAEQAAQAAPEEATAPVEPRMPAALRPRLATQTPLEAAIADLASDPYSRAVLDRLTRISELIHQALREDRVDEALAAMSALAGLEPGAPEGTARNSYSIVIRRTLSREALTQLASHALDPRITEQVAVVMRRGAVEAADVLLGLLSVSESRRERRTYMQILRTLPRGLDQAIHMLSHDQWFVVRNVADLMGDVRIEEAVPALTRLLSHSDARVRSSAASALARIGTASTVDPLRTVLKEGDAELKTIVAESVGPHSRALVMPLVTLIGSEGNARVVREYTIALGRIGSPEAVQALVQAAEPGGRLMGRKSAAQRLAAVEGLKLAAAKRPLQALTADADKQVSEAAKAALEELKQSG
jgi:HEAT repeat protein